MMRSCEQKNTIYMQKDFNRKINQYKLQQEAEMKLFEMRRNRNNYVA